MANTENETIYCSTIAYAATLTDPAEYCENEVEDEGDLCPTCAREADGPDPDDERDRWLEAQYDDRDDYADYDY